MKNTKRALFASVLSIVVCLSMLVGSTFAWFTDTASTAVNKIQSGTLDVDLVDADGNTLEGKTLSFANKDGQTDILWEPGCTYVLEDIFVVNNGNLALKYEIIITGIDGDAKLNEAIEWAYGDGGKTAILLPGEKSEAIVISGHMLEEAGNEYQDLTIDGIGITVLATQLPYETDSFDDQYDKDAEYDMAVDTANKLVHITTAEALREFAAAYNAGELNGYTVEIDADIDLAGENWVPMNRWDPEKNNITIDGNGHTISNMTVNSGSMAGFFGQTSGNVTIKNLTFANASVTTSGSFAGVVVGKAYAKDVIDNVKVVDSTVVTTAEKGIRLGGLVGAAMIHDGGKLTVTNSTVSGTTVKGYHNVAGLVGSLMSYDSNSNWKVEGNTVKDSMVIYSSSNPIDSDPFAANGATRDNPVIPGNTVDNVIFVNNANLVLIATAEELFAFANDVNANGNTYAGKTVVLTADIDLANAAWTPIGQTGATQFLGTFDGQGHTISNLYIDSSAQTGATYSTGLFGWIERHGSDANYLMAVKNVNVDGATVKGHHNVAVIAGYLIGTVENCHVTNATVECTHANDDACGDKAGVIVGIAAETNALVKDCSATDSTVAAGRDAGQVVGSSIVGKVENCKATNVVVSATGDCTGKNVNNAIVGRTN